MKALAALAVILAGATLGERLASGTNSRAAAERGLAAYRARDYDAAVSEFGKAAALRPGPEAAFDLGTAQIAGGRRAEGSATLEQALEDPALRADVYFNRGNSALAAGALDHALADYREALRQRPDFAAAKRNLEIALRRRQQSGAGESSQAPQAPPPQGDQEPEQRRGEEDTAEALLRSVEQQEREELSRMRRGRGGAGRVGW